mmetsp:Transcript_37424/g.60289  ORF Transcript_37424/g.60289 Transcript_37424/m.60289 type:complete len:264 (-) Transcript_37424:40-831(-)|eukprot:CAMPEP_0179430808 /NCGR_PEP_ID=MMETSP0799-20121207/15846_1 /TAXON_ID=46947 /ORGANISM="Geminigera cryophila, Strain CCMP2564" /LENGTH=263 /DNA_ID=CAMNT_0021207405 /DNA_START=25 /DNA_END=816 /DNA_ORIENTATION=+
MPSSRPVSARRPGHDIPEKIVVRNYLQPRTINEAKARSRVSFQEVLGSIAATTIFFAFALTTFIIWVSSYIVPYGTYMRADCLVLNSTQTVLMEGFQREPLYRAEVYVYVFNTTYPECCCKNSFGKERCAEWEAISYDNVHETHTPGDKWDFLRNYGYPSTFHKCWHSPDKKTVLLKRSNQSPFLMAPIASFIVGIYAAYLAYAKVKAYRAAQFYVDKFSGKLRDENELEEQESLVNDDQPHGGQGGEADDTPGDDEYRDEET